MRTTLALLAVVLLGLPVRAADAASEGQATVVAPYVNDQTFLVAHVDVSRVDVDLIAKLSGDDVEKVKAVATLAKTTFLRSGGKDLYVVMSWESPTDDLLIVAPLANGAAGQGLTGLVGQIPGFQAEVKGSVFLAGTKKAMTRLKSFRAQAQPDLAKAFAAVGEGSAQVVFLPPFALKRAFVEMYPQLPQELGGGNSSALDFQWAAARIDAGGVLGLKMVAQAPDAKAAEKIGKIAERALDFAAKNSAEMKHDLPDAAKILPLLTPKVQGDRLTLSLNDTDLNTVLLPLIAKRRLAAGRMVSVNNLKQIGLAMHNYLDTYKTFPAAATYNAQGQPLLSWRVYILPFIEQDALFRQFHLDEPWDSEHNKKLIPQMPTIYRSPAQKNGAEGKTTYLAPVGQKTIFGGKKGMPIQKITDGTSNTIMLVEADDSRAVIWTQPNDYKIDPDNPKAGLVRPGTRGFNAAFADGSVRMLLDTIDAATLRALFTANGGESVNLP
jgi:prepilin-type processing-associated H-X9-DG protein